MHTGRSVDFLVFASTEGLTKQLAARGQELGECKAALTDFARRLEEVQGELVLQRAQKRIDDRELRRVQRDCGSLCLAARGEVAESRMMQRHYL
jgi:hypothetical protein